MAGNVTPESSRRSYITQYKGTFILAAAVIVALTGIAFAFFHLGQRSSVEAYENSAATPLAARVDQVDGDVGIAPEFNGQDQNNVDWLKATVNSPVSVGDRIYVRDGGKAGIAFGDRSYARLDSNTMLDVVTMTEQRTQLALRNGSATFDCGGLQSNDFFEVETPDGAVDFKQPGMYQISFNDSGHAVVNVLSGQAQVVGVSGSGIISKGESLTLGVVAANDGTTNNNNVTAVSSRLEPRYAGGIVDDYYRYRYPKKYDGRYINYDAYLGDPFYYEPYHSASYQYFDNDDYIAGIDDLDTYGTWEDIDGYGHCWRPSGVAVDWAPYSDGYWDTDYPWGLTWVSSESWGWAPYHYGRWGYVQNSWYWIPGPRETRAVYAPALVAFVSIPERREVGWVPLGPGDRYVPRYYNNSWQAQFIAGRREVAFNRTANFNAPGAVTVVNVNNFNRPINRTVIERTDPAFLARTRPVADPFAVPAIRDHVRDISAARQRVAVPQDVQRQAFSREVVASRAPVLPPSLRNNERAMQIQQVREAQAGRRLQINNSGQVIGSQFAQRQIQQQVQQNANNAVMEQQRQARMNALQQQAAQGNRRASIELRRLQQQQSQPDAIHAGVNPRGQAQQADQQRQQQMQQQRAVQQQAAQQQQALRNQQRQQQMNNQRQAAQQQQVLRNQQRQQQMNNQRQASQQQQALRNQQMQQQRAAQQQRVLRSQQNQQQRAAQQEQRALRNQQMQQQRAAQQQRVLQQRQQMRPPQQSRPQMAPRPQMQQRPPQQPRPQAQPRPQQARPQGPPHAQPPQPRKKGGPGGH